MKKIRIVGILCLILVLFIGCNPDEDPVYSEVIRENGEYFLRVYNGDTLEVPCLPDVMWCTKFDSVDEIKRLIKENDFSREKTESLYWGLDCVEDDRGLFPIIDPDRMLVPVFNGSSDYDRLGLLNRTFWCTMFTTYQNVQCKLTFYTDYETSYKTEFPKEKLEQKIQNGNYKQYLEYVEDGVEKHELTYESSYHKSKEIFYEITTDDISYSIIERHERNEEDKLIYLSATLYGVIENVGQFAVSIGTMDGSPLYKDFVQMVMHSIELKKA